MLSEKHLIGENRGKVTRYNLELPGQGCSEEVSFDLKPVEREEPAMCTPGGRRSRNCM